MDNKEALRIIRAELEPFRSKPHSELVKMIDGEPVIGERDGKDGKHYQFEIQAFWDDEPKSHVRVSGSIDDGGWRSFFPLTDSFIRTASNEFIDQ